MYKELIPVIGTEATEKLIRAFGGLTVYLSSPIILDIQTRRDRVLKLHHDGIEVREIARATGLSLRHIYRIISK